jgi:hypothetical protein
LTQVNELFLLPAAHALTGCDTTSSFFGVGKKIIYKVLKDSQKEFVDLSQISCDDIETSVAVDPSAFLFTQPNCNGDLTGG